MQTIYEKKHCWQYEIRLCNLESDLNEAGLTKESAGLLKVSDFDFEFVHRSNIKKCREITKFIEKHEWLGINHKWATHRFVATYKGIIAGVIVMATPNAFSNILGKENRHLEKLIARGACISWSPKNLGSWLVMRSIDWMVKNTEFRVFSAYSDVEAKELGTIYQACNFIYLGNKFGGRSEFFDPKNPQRGWFSGRVFRKVGQYKRYARHLGISWDMSWNTAGKMSWNKVPSHIHAQLAKASVEYREACIERPLPPKHKYIYIKGKTKGETKRLLKTFFEANPKMRPKGLRSRGGLPYPKVRGE